ncbi:MAG: ribonuclease III, partial [Lachnospiraceae bacterium]|nr:ribonuclease III [Lachnospiraceae bacterium]
MRNRKELLKELQEKIGYQFQNEGLLRQALTHSSFANEQKINKLSDYERLEFLGDAVLEMVSSEFLFHENPEMPEGQLTRLRASMVCEPALAYCARDID